MTDSAAPEDASPPVVVAKPAAGRWAKLWGQLKRFRGPIAAIAAFGAMLSGFLGYWSAYQTVEKVVVPKSALAVVTADAGPLSIVVLLFSTFTDANLYSIILSPGVGNPAPSNGAPEPPTLTLLGIGLAGLGFSRRKH